MTMTSPHPQLLPVILSGGAGSRLWPLSRSLQPKQLLPLTGEKTLLQETALRLGREADVLPPLVIANAEHRFMVAEQFRAIEMAPSAIILEPVARNTAPAVAVAAAWAMVRDPGMLLLVMPADHVMADPAGFAAAVRRAVPAAEAGRIVTFGITPDRVETGFGHIERGAPLAEADGVFAVARFIEKPPRPLAEELTRGGRHDWNAGLFLFRADAMIAALEQHAPAVLSAARLALHKAATDLDFLRLDGEAFAEAPSISIDYAVMEKTDRAAMLPVSLGWNDVGSFAALWDLAKKDASGTVAIGDVATVDTTNCYIRSDSVLTATVGVSDLIVVTTEDSVLVCHKDKAQDIKTLVDKLKTAKRPEADSHRRVDRPWGYYQVLHQGTRFQVKRLSVRPGGRLSLQMHHHRAEHWVVVNGTALVTRDQEQVLVRENESIYIPLGAVHRVENPGKLELNLIEVQSGSYLGEDDIVRYEDNYGRVE